MHGAFAAPSRASPDLEAPDVVQGRLDPQHAQLFIIHLHRVFLDPVLDPHSFGTVTDVRAGLAIEPGVGAPAQKLHHIVATELAQRVLHELWINARQACRITEQDIGGVLAFTHAPVIAKEIELPGQWIDAPGQRAKKPRPFAVLQLLHHLLRPRQIVNPREAVVPLLKPDPRSGHLPRQPLAAIDADLNVKRKPALKSNVHQSKVTIHVVEVEKQALAILPDELELCFLALSLDAKALADLHTPQHADQPIADPVLCEAIAQALKTQLDQMG